MISFPCTECGRRFDRPDSSAGTLVWCTCGARNVVPWASTLPDPPAMPPAAPAPVPVPAWSEPVPVSWLPPQPAIREHNPAYCFNHQQTPREHTCAECGEEFCGDCVTTLQGRTLCGPCKNLALRKLQKPRRPSALAVLSPVLSLIVAPVMVIAMPMMAGFMMAASMGGGSSGGEGLAIAAVALFGVGLQLIAFLIGLGGLRITESNPHLSGQSLAITGMIAAVVCSVLQAEMAVLFIRVIP